MPRSSSRNRNKVSPAKRQMERGGRLPSRWFHPVLDRLLFWRQADTLPRRPVGRWFLPILERLEDRLAPASGPWVVNLTPTEAINSTFDHIDVKFNEAIDPTSFDAQDVAITGPSSSVTPTGINQVSADTYRVSFAPLTERGDYRVTIGPDVTDLTGNRMDQNKNGVNGEATDAYTATLGYAVADAIFSSATTINENNTSYDGLNILIDGATVAINGPHAFGSVQLIDGAVLTHTANTATQTHDLDLTVTDQVIVDGSSRIDVSGKGYLPGYTTGNTTQGAATGSAGGSYGGLGGDYNAGLPNSVYGDYTDPDDWGSGTGPQGGGTGGGLVRITAAQLNLDGQILARGAEQHGGGGAGGGIAIAVGQLSGAGVIDASGAVGNFGGGGSGGRIAVSTADFGDFDVSRITAFGGTGYYNVPGGPGTVYLRDTTQPQGTLIFDRGSQGDGWAILGLPGQDTVTIPDAVVIRGNSTQVRSEHVGMTFDFQGSLTVSGAILNLESANWNSGTILASNGGTVSLSNTSVNSGELLVSGVGSQATFQGTYAFGTGATAFADAGGQIIFSGTFTGSGQGITLLGGSGTYLFNGIGTSAVPLLIEVPSVDHGAVQAAFSNNFTDGFLRLTGNAVVRLVDNHHTTPGTAHEAFYANSLVVAAGSLFDLNGLNAYTRVEQIDGAITGGSLNQVPSNGGSISLNNPTAATLGKAGELDEWAFFGRSGQLVTVIVNPGDSTTLPVPDPTLGYASVQILDSVGNVLATGSSSSQGAPISLPNVVLPTDGIYRVQVRADAGHSSNTGNYVIAAWEATINTLPVLLNQSITSVLSNPYTTDRWTFSAAAGTQIRFHLINVASNGIQFALTGPNGFTGFTGLTVDSDLLTLPVGGTYTLQVTSGGVASGGYAFSLQQTSLTDLPINTAYNGTLPGSSSAQLFRVNLSVTQQLLLSLQDSSAADHNEVYVKYGAPPTRTDYQYSFATPASANQRVLVPSAAAGDWYVLVYGDYVPTPSTFTLTATAANLFLFDSTPTRQGTAKDTFMTLTGAGFDNTSTVSLIADDGTSYPAETVQFGSPTKLSAIFASASVPAGQYSIHVAQPSGDSATLTNAFSTTAPRQMIFYARGGFGTRRLWEA